MTDILLKLFKVYVVCIENLISGGSYGRYLDKHASFSFSRWLYHLVGVDLFPLAPEDICSAFWTEQIIEA